MRRAFCLSLILALAALTVSPTIDAQLRVQPLPTTGTAALALQIRKLESVGTLMMTTAHPDDENNALLSWASTGLGMRTTLVTATRGNGGQNEIGPELFQPLAVLRTEELLAAHRFDGAEQYFTRAVDFGYSFSVEETFQKWGKEEILGDYVRMIRTLRPDVIVAFLWDGTGGGQHHQASARITAEAFRAAADPTKYPEQIKEGLHPWQAKKFYYTAGFGRGNASAETSGNGPRILEVDCSYYDPILGRTYTDLGTEARTMHKCQGMSQRLQLPGDRVARRYVLHDTVLDGGLDREEMSVFDGIDSTWRSLLRFAGDEPPTPLVTLIERITGFLADAEQLQRRGALEAADPLAEALRAARQLRDALPTLELDDEARYEIDFRLAQKIKQFEEALVLATGLQVDVLADDGLVHPGQPLEVRVVAAAMENSRVLIKGEHVSGFEHQSGKCDEAETRAGEQYTCKLSVSVPADTGYSTPYFTPRKDAARDDFAPDAPFGLPHRPTPFRVALDARVYGVEMTIERPVMYRYSDVMAGEKTMELLVVPQLAVNVSPKITVLPRQTVTTTSTAAEGSADTPRALQVTVINNTKGATKADVALDLPAGWTSTPTSAPVTFAREDESATVRFVITPPANVAEGEVKIAAHARVGTQQYSDGYDVIEYPHTMRRHVVVPAETRVKVLDVRTAPNLLVGYIVGVGDEVPNALAQIGAKVEFIDADTLAWGDLSRFDVIVTGVRAYERRTDLRANNQRLLDYAERGGTVVVQYNKFEFNEAQYGPFPAKVSANRVTDEHGPVAVLVPEHQVFTWPNTITPKAFDGWIQERGLYFLGDRDARYADLLEVEETFEYNKGVKRGALVEAKVGTGRWLYVGLGLWRQLPAGTDGAYQLMANIISLGKAPGKTHEAAF